ncbi:hypothetical protein WIB15_11415 [Enterobacter hormaechei]
MQILRHAAVRKGGDNRIANLNAVAASLLFHHMLWNAGHRVDRGKE